LTQFRGYKITNSSGIYPKVDESKPTDLKNSCGPKTCSVTGFDTKKLEPLAFNEYCRFDISAFEYRINGGSLYSAFAAKNSAVNLVMNMKILQY
jgi:hypothetical protein